MPAAANNKVMLVEDDATMQSVLRTLLELEGFTVAVAPNLRDQQELQNYIRIEKPDVMLLDVHLRDANGLDILHLLRQDAETAATRVIMTSGMDVQDRCMAAGADGFILKPFMPDELIDKLRGKSTQALP